MKYINDDIIFTLLLLTQKKKHLMKLIFKFVKESNATDNLDQTDISNELRALVSV